MDGQRQFGAESPRHGAGVASEVLDQRYNSAYARSGEGRTTPRNPTPLQASETLSMARENGDNTSEKESYSPFQAKYASEIPRSKKDGGYTEPKSPRERLDEFLAAEDPTSNGKMSAGEQRALRNATASPTKASSYSQLRNASSPLPDLMSSGHSSPPSPRTTVSPHFTSPVPWTQPGPGQNARTSSIDSAISNIAVHQQVRSGGHSPKESSDMTPISTSDMSNLIRSAGSPEAVIQHLLKEKATAKARQTQLWDLTIKQRSLILGLNKDLERAFEDKERYRRRLKDLDKPAPLATVPKPLVPQTRMDSHSSESDSSVELPMQKQNEEIPGPVSPAENGIVSQREPIRAEEMKGASPRMTQTKGTAVVTSDGIERKSPKPSGHTHTKTSSSDLNVLGPFSSVYGVTTIQTRELDTPAPLSNSKIPQTPPGATSNMSPSTSFTAKRSVVSPSKSINGEIPGFSTTAPTPVDTEAPTPSRKLPPAPLNLGNAKPESSGPDYGADVYSDSDYGDKEVDELVDRGRKKTREDDDRERQAALLKEKEERSRSKKEKASKSRSASAKTNAKDTKAHRAVPIPASVKGLSPETSNANASSFLSQPASIAGLLQPQAPKPESSISERTLTAMPLSPGLPVSPRPMDRPMNQPPPTPRLPRDGPGPSVASPPLSARPGVVGLPLSPRAPRQQFPFLPHTPMSMAPASPMPTTEEPRKDSGASEGSGSSLKQDTSSSHTQVDSENANHVHQSRESRSGSGKGQGVYKGFVSESYPNLLIPPNALPSIKIKVVSSRLKPSRNSLVLKGANDEPVFTLGVSARSDRQALWQIEKSTLSLQQLDQALRQYSGFDVNLPARSLFSGHAPAKIDARRQALESYFEAVLDTQLDEKSAVALCKYLSTHVSEPEVAETNGLASTPDPASIKRKGSDGRPTKEGYMSKCGKTFGNWKERYFVLSGPVLEYYEAQGSRSGPLGKINLHNAQIGRQRSPTRGGDRDGKYRHTLLIKEPKRKDPNSFLDHLLCAESDEERDSWVAALTCYVDGSASYGAENDDKNRPNSKASGGSARADPTKKNLSKDEHPLEDSPDSDIFDTLQTVPYEETQVAQAPHVSVPQDLRSTETPSPTSFGVAPSTRAPSAQSKAISGPQNGAKINNVQKWGNKPMASPLPKPTEQKKRGRWGFRENKNEHLGVHQGNSNLGMTPQQQEYQEHATSVKAVFRAPLAEAVEYCAPRGVDVCLPAVVYRCLEYLEAKNAAGEVGIFRQSGSSALITTLQMRFNMEGDYDFLGDNEPFYDIHAVASLLKLYLRELPANILTSTLLSHFVAIMEYKMEDSKKIQVYNVLVHQLPKPNYCLLRAVTAYLIAVINASHVNLMDAKNICIVFSPTLSLPGPLISTFLTAFDDIFENPLSMEDIRGIPQLAMTASPPESLGPEDIRSPRKQMFSDPLPTPSYNQDSFGGHSMNAVLANNHHQRVNQANNDTGFIPMQPAYDEQDPISVPYSQTQEPDNVTVAGPEYAVAKPRNLAPGGTAKSRRRESSMLLMGPAQRKSSLPMMRDDEDGE